MSGALLGLLGSNSASAPANTISIANATPNHTRLSPNTATATYALNSSGTITCTGNPQPAWIDPQTNMSSYEARATLVSRSTPSGTFGSWLSLGTTRSWSLSTSGVGFTTAKIQIEIRKIGETTVLDSAFISFTAEVQVFG